MPKTTAPIPTADTDLSYEAALQQLEALVARMDSGQMPLDELLAGYSRGAALLKLCRDKLAAVEQQIKLLDENNKS
jgi:exodeoxyribonuclease VII small subunit